MRPNRMPRTSSFICQPHTSSRISVHRGLETGSPRMSLGRMASQSRQVTYSTTAWVLASGVWTTSTPRLRHATTSMLSRPTPARPTTRSPKTVQQRVVYDRVGPNDQSLQAGSHLRELRGVGREVHHLATLREPGLGPRIEMFRASDQRGGGSRRGGHRRDASPFTADRRSGSVRSSTVDPRSTGRLSSRRGID